MRVELNRLQRQLNHTFVHVTHDQEEAMAVADRLCVMKDGRVEQIGTPLELYNAPQNRYVARQLGSPPINFISGNFDVSSGVFEASDMPLAAVTTKANAGHGAALARRSTRRSEHRRQIRGGRLGAGGNL